MKKIFQLLKILFLYLFYFRRQKAKSNLRVEQKVLDWWHFMSMSLPNQRFPLLIYYAHYTVLCSCKIAYSLSSLHYFFPKAREIVFATQVLFSSCCHVQKWQVPFAVVDKGKFISSLHWSRILFTDSDRVSYQT